MSIAIGSDLTSLYQNIYSEGTAGSTSASSLQSAIETTDYSSATDEELMDACKEFETYFTEQVFKALKKMVPEDETTSSTTSSTLDYFGDMLIQEYADASTENGSLGIAQMLYEQMKNNYNL